MNVLGIDLGGKYAGVSLVEHPTNRVLYSATIELRDDVKDLMDTRRSLRRTRRYRLWYRPARFDNRVRTQCKYVDKSTGEICENNTPRKENVKHLLLENILRYLEISKEEKAKIRNVLSCSESLSKKKEILEEIFKNLSINKYSKKQISDLILNKLEGRAAFCRKHIPFYTEMPDIETQSIWTAPSITTKRQQLLNTVETIKRQYPIDKVIIERANFDLQKIEHPELNAPDDWMKGPRFGFRNLFEALKQEFGNRCCYCGKSPTEDKKIKLQIDHVYPKGEEEINRFDNLVLACKKCNKKKGGRTPEEAGMDFATVNEFEPSIGRNIKRKLAPRSLSESRISKYMTHTDIGIRLLKNEIKDIVDCPLEETYGYITSAFRNYWRLKKEHHNDAIVIASTHENKQPPLKEVKPEYLKQRDCGKRLFDTNPLQKRDDDFFQQITLIGRKSFAGERSFGSFSPAQIEKVVDPHKKEILEKLRDKLQLSPTSKKDFPVDSLLKLPFKSVRIIKKDASNSNTIKKKNNWLKVATSVNDAVVVYNSTEGKKRFYVIKNPKIFGRTSRPADFQSFVTSFRKGNIVKFKLNSTRKEGEIIKIFSNGSLTIRLVKGEETATRSPLAVKKSVSQQVVNLPQKNT